MCIHTQTHKKTRTQTQWQKNTQRLICVCECVLWHKDLCKCVMLYLLAGTRKCKYRHIYINIHVYIYIYLYMCVSIYIYIYVFIYFYIYIYKYMCIHIHVYIYVYIYINIYTTYTVWCFIHVCMYICIYAYIWTYTLHIQSGARCATSDGRCTRTFITHGHVVFCVSLGRFNRVSLQAGVGGQIFLATKPNAEIYACTPAHTHTHVYTSTHTHTRGMKLSVGNEQGVLSKSECGAVVGGELCAAGMAVSKTPKLRLLLKPLSRYVVLCTRWRRCIGCLVFICHFPQKSHTIDGSFAERDM